MPIVPLSQPCLFRTVISVGVLNFQPKHADDCIIEILSCGLHVMYNKRGPQLSYDWLL